MLSLRILMVFLLLGLPCYAQTDAQFLAVTDMSGPHSPIKVTGQVSWYQEIGEDSKVNTACWASMDLANLSSKSILAYEVSFDIFPRYGGRRHIVFHHDGFFTEDINFFASGLQKPLDHDCSTKEWQSDQSGAPIKPQRFEGIPRAESKVTFVQFSDGSTYGASDRGKNLNESRFILVERINELLEAYKGGEESLRAMLAKQLANPDNLDYLQLTLDGFAHQLKSEGIEIFVAGLNEKLHMAVECAPLLRYPTERVLEEAEDPISFP